MRISDSQIHGNAPQKYSTPPLSSGQQTETTIPGSGESAAQKKELANAVYSAFLGFRHDAKSFVDAVLEEIISALMVEEKVSLREFGTFTVREKRDRIGRNPKIGVGALIVLFPCLRRSARK